MSTKENPLVSICTIVYNGEHYISEMLKSVLAQTYTGFEWVIVDDGSIDNTTGLIEAVNDSRIKLLSLKHEGIIAARNSALKACKGQFIAVLDADDLMMPDRLEKQVSELLQDRDLGLVGSWVQTIDPRGKLLNIWRFPVENSALQWHLLLTSIFCHSAVMFRSAVLDDIGGYTEDKELNGVEDYHFFVQLAKNYKLSTIPEVLTCYRIHSESFTHQNRQQSAQRAIKVAHSQFEKQLCRTVPVELVEILFLCGYTETTWPKVFNSIRLYTKMLKDYLPKVMKDTQPAVLGEYFLRTTSVPINYFFYKLFGNRALKTNNISQLFFIRLELSRYISRVFKFINVL